MKRILVLLSAAAFLLLLLIWVDRLPDSAPETEDQGVRFTGSITEIDTSCWSDGACRIKVGDDWITVEIGGLHPPDQTPPVRGRLIGISFDNDVDKHVGNLVQVYAGRQDDDGYTIYGNESYYIRILD